MVIIQGQGVCGGVAFGKLHILHGMEHKVHRFHVTDVRAEWERFEHAEAVVDTQLHELYLKARSEVGEENATIFDIHRMMLKDPDYRHAIRTVIEEQHLNAESAVAAASDTFQEMFSSMDDSYMQARASDVKDISERILSVLSGDAKVGFSSDTPVIIAADDLAPSETVQLDKSKILAFVTALGSPTSHTSILARTMNIPAIIGADKITDSRFRGADTIADGFTGTVYIDPDMQTVLKMQKKQQDVQRQNALLTKLKGTEPVTKDGQKILLYANIGSPNDMPEVYANDGMGVGLFRSEFIYLERKTCPTEEEQFHAYKSVLQKAMGKRVIIRTLDIGADKQVDYFSLPKEENPAMGIRAIRLCLTRPELLKTQLRALYRASVFGKLSIMLPMITSVQEIAQVKQLREEIFWELTKEHLPFCKDTELGVMIETPAAALISDKLAKEVDFFSVGTNDLTQYTLAVDRQNPAADAFCDPHHLALLRMIRLITENAHKAGIWVGICGELAADTNLTELFLAIGIDELSVSPGRILPLKQKVLACNAKQARAKLLPSLD